MPKANGQGRLVPAVGYLRRSGDNESQETSIPDQKKEVQAYAIVRGYIILRWYVDDAISGDATEKRHDFLRMIADARDLGDFEVVLCWDRARFGRFDSIEYGYYVFPLREAGVRLATVLDGTVDWDSMVGRATETLHQEGKHQQLIDLSGNVTRGQMNAAKAGSWVGAPPYGYRIEGGKKDKRLVLGEPAHVRVVQRIFREYVHDGRSLNDIARRLQADGYPTPRGRGKGWCPDTVRVILANPAYCGDFTAGRHGGGKYHTIRDGQIVRVLKGGKATARPPRSQWIIHRDHYDPIIDRPTFERAAAVLAKGKTGRGPYTPETNPFLFSGLLRCGKCGCPMWMGKYLRYECGNRKENGTDACPGTYVGEAQVMHSIADHLDREFFDLDGEAVARRAGRGELKPGDLPEAFAKVKNLVAPPRQPSVDRKRVVKQAATLTQQIDKATANLVLLDPENIPAAQERIKQMRSERELLEAELRKRPPTESDVNAEATEVLRALWWLRHLFRSAAQEAELGDDPTDWIDFLEGGREENGGRPVGFMTGAALTPAVRQYLRKIEGITVHTRIEGSGTRTRHILLGGEINLNPVRAMPRDSNLRRLGQSQGAYR